MDRQVIIDSVSKKVKRHGYCTFDYDAETESLVMTTFEFNPSIREQDWYWNGTTFQKTQV